jgi:hypothetical protein
MGQDNLPALPKKEEDTSDVLACAGYLGYPFKNQEVNSPARNLNATYLMQKLQRKRKGRSIFSALFWNG